MQDEILVARILNGDKGAFALVVERYKNTVFGVCMKILRHYEDAEDMAQEVFLAAYRKLPQLEDGAKLRPWLVQIAKYQCFDELRRRKKLGLSEELPETIVSAELSPEEVLLWKEDTQKLLAGIALLPEHLRVTVSLRYLHGLSTAETADKLQIPEGTVKSRLSTGLSKLRKEVFGMTERKEEKREVGEDFVEKVMSMAKSLRRYTRTENFDGKYKEVLENIARMPDSKEKNEAKATALIYRSWVEKISEEDKKFIEENQTPECVISDFIEKLLNSANYKEWEKNIPVYIEKAKELNYPNGEGELRFWLGRAYAALEKYDEAYAEFEKANALLNRENSYYPNSVSAMRYIKKLKASEGNKNMKYSGSVCGETLTLTKNRLYFISQPGWGFGGSSRGRFNSIFYYCSRVGDMFYDSSLSVGESVKDKEGNILTCISRDRKVETPSGIFENCTVFFSDITDDSFNFTAEAAYKEGVGIVRLHFASVADEETYELAEYNIAGGEGLLPLAVGNRWVYKDPATPSYIDGSCEREIVFFDKDYAGFAALDFAAMDLDIEKYPDIDSKVFFNCADEICDSMSRTDPYDAEKVEEARRAFCRAVQLASNSREAAMASAALEHLEKRAAYMRAGYRLLPSSVSFNIVNRKGDDIKLTNKVSVCPFYDLGKRGYDNKIWGMKIYRYLQGFCGTLFDKRWLCVLGGEKFSETKNEGAGDDEIRISAEKVSAVSVAAGVFRDCIAVTIEKGRLDGDYAYYWNNDSAFYLRGKKTFYFAPNVGIVKMVCLWGDTRRSSTELSSYRTVSTSGEYMPFYYGMEWHYNETTFREKYVAEVNVKITGGTADAAEMVYEQNVYYAASEEEYNAMRRVPSEA